MAKVLDESGNELNATFSVAMHDAAYAVFFESAGDTANARNTDYVPGLLLLLRRLRDAGGRLLEVALNRINEDRPAAERRLTLEGHNYPVDLSLVQDLSELRFAMTRAQARAGRDPNRNSGSGNSRKRIRLDVQLDARVDVTAFESFLAGDADLPVPLAGAIAPAAIVDRPATLVEIVAAIENYSWDLLTRRASVIADRTWIHDPSRDAFYPASEIGGAGDSHAWERAVAAALGARGFRSDDTLRAKLQSFLRARFGEDFRLLYENDVRFVDLPGEVSRRQRKLRPFDPNRPPVMRQPRRVPRPQEEVLALLEKATREHEAMLVALYRWLDAAGWTELREDRYGLDLIGSHPSGARAIFEAKTIANNEADQVRSSIGQLFEYRHFEGEPGDRLFLVTNERVSPDRLSLLRALAIEAIWWRDGRPVLLTANEGNLF